MDYTGTLGLLCSVPSFFGVEVGGGVGTRQPNVPSKQPTSRRQANKRKLTEKIGKSSLLLK